MESLQRTKKAAKMLMIPLKELDKGEKRENPKQADGLDWEELRKELRNLFNFNAENRSWGIILKTSLIIFATSLAPSLFDMGSDAFSVYNFINGTTYTKNVPDLNHPSVNSSKCIHVGTHLRRDGNSSEVVYEEFECFERDPIWGYMSLVFILLPGLGGGLVWKGLTKCQEFGFSHLTLPIFPFFLLTVKTIGLFNPGKNWKILAGRCGTVEGNLESRFQFLLQLFIVFTRADRAPSTVQLGAMASSVVMLAISGLNDVRRKQKNVDLGTDVQRAIHLLPAILAYHVSSIGTMALLASLLRYWVLVPLGVVVAAMYIFWGYIRFCNPKYWAMMDDDTKGRVSVGLIKINKFEVVQNLFFKIIWLILFLVLTGLTITANVHPSLKMSALDWEVRLSNFHY